MCDHPAVRWLGEDNRVVDFTCRDLKEQTSRFANLLKGFGLDKGDRVFVLAGRIPELYVAVLGTLKAAGVICPLFSAFGPEPIYQRCRQDHAEASQSPGAGPARGRHINRGGRKMNAKSTSKKAAARIDSAHARHLIAGSEYGLMVQILGGLITYMLLTIYCREQHNEKVTIKRVRELRIKIQNESYCQMLCMKESGGVPYFLNTINKFNTSNNFA